eukprot:maker-scaffold447_size167621-snap-gene-0.42 protein:Tk02115 transcript:maker-scaffold447_size167621-snap-gene-0.42-mRNA-1 annotation:"hypothetical protein DAPPUDRAFT_302576"
MQTLPIGQASKVVKAESFSWNDWTFHTRKGPIMSQSEEKTFDSVLSLPHLPDMLFAQNVVRLTKQLEDGNSEVGFQLDALGALKTVNDHDDLVHVATSKNWLAARKDSPHINKIIKPYDWTYTPATYRGTLIGDADQIKVEPCPHGIDYDKLKEREKILFFDEVILYEDELDDNGCSVLSSKLRVMPSGFFCLLRFYLRVDNTLIRVLDNRFHFETDKGYIVREFTLRESNFSDITVPMSVQNDPNGIGEHLKLVEEVHERILLPR